MSIFAKPHSTRVSMIHGIDSECVSEVIIDGQCGGLKGQPRCCA